MNKTHLNQFLRLSSDDHRWVGYRPRDWWIQVFGDRATRLGCHYLSRDQLKALCENDKYSAKDVFGAVMAWGGMRRNHGRAHIANLSAMCKIINGLRSGTLTRSEAYSQFFERRRNGMLPGMGPAYYTKLIFFCNPKHDGYIMDQWTSKSINLIYGNDLVALKSNRYVSDKNDVQAYNKFCSAIEVLAKCGNWSPEGTEIRLFSHGGRPKGAWRNYVIKCYARNFSRS